MWNNSSKETKDKDTRKILMTDKNYNAVKMKIRSISIFQLIVILFEIRCTRLMQIQIMKSKTL